MHVMFSFHVIFPQNFTGNGILFQFRRNIYHGKQPLMTAMTMIVIWWLFILVMVLGDCVTMMPCCCCCRYCCSPYMIIWLHTTLHDDPHPKNSTKSGVRRSHSNYVMDVCMYVVKVVVWWCGCLFLMLMLLMSLPSTARATFVMYLSSHILMFYFLVVLFIPIKNMKTSHRRIKPKK